MEAGRSIGCGSRRLRSAGRSTGVSCRAFGVSARWARSAQGGAHAGVASVRTAAGDQGARAIAHRSTTATKSDRCVRFKLLQRDDERRVEKVRERERAAVRAREIKAAEAADAARRAISEPRRTRGGAVF
eukprot:7390963-Prymnesium_polylepis.1